MSTLLRFTNPYGERFFFVRLGEQWPHNPARRLVNETTSTRAHAREFPDAEAAREALVVGGCELFTKDRGWGWEVVEG